MNIHIMVLYIYQRHIKEVTVKNDKDPLDSIVPLVLPTQLDSEDSESGNEENGKGGEDINEDLETKQYDEDIDGHISVDRYVHEHVMYITHECFSGKSVHQTNSCLCAGIAGM